MQNMNFSFFSEENIFIFLVQVFLLLGFAKVLGELFRKWRQPVLTAEILVGVLLGPTIFGRFLPSLHNIVFPATAIQQNMLETIAWLGLLFFLLNMGLEMDFSSAWRQRGDALKIALTDIIVPMLIAFVPCFFLPDYYLVNPQQRLIFAIFMATVMTISALPIAGRALRDLDIYKTDLGYLIMAALSVNDIIGWVIFTLVLGLFTVSNIEIFRVGVILFSTFAFTVICLTIGRNFANFVIGKIKEKGFPEPASSLTFICLLGFLCGSITQKIGIHALFGFFIAGIMAGGAYALSERTRDVISQMVHAIFVPLFFASIGLRVDFLRNFDIFLVLLISVIGILARFLGAWLGVSFTKLSRSNRLPLAIAHTPGGSMEIVVGILALEYNMITEPVFVAIVFGALISSVILGPWLTYALRMRKEISILEFFNRTAISPQLKATDRNGAILELCNLAGEEQNMPQAEFLYQAVLTRENIMGTAIEKGVALPHARIPNLNKPVVIFGKSEYGIEWNSPDGQESHFIFLILTPQGDDASQVQILRIIAKAMDENRIRNRIMQAQEAQKIWEILQESFTSHHIVRKQGNKK